MFGQWGNMVKIGMLQAGKRVKFSRADLLNYTINLLEIKKRVNTEQYRKIYELFLEISKDKEKIEMDLSKYKSTIEDISKQFISIAPKELSEILNVKE